MLCASKVHTHAILELVPLLSRERTRAVSSIFGVPQLISWAVLLVKRSEQEIDREYYKVHMLKGPEAKRARTTLE